MGSRKQKPRSLDRGLRLNLFKSGWLLLAHPDPKLGRRRYSGKPVVVGSKNGARGKSCHKISSLRINSDGNAYCSELATLENALLAFEPISLTVPTTNTRMTANITAYSAMSCPESSDQSLRIRLTMLYSSG